MGDFSRVTELRTACLDNAHELLVSAKAVRALNLNNIAYHLASLSLEEIGKATIILMRAAVEELTPEKEQPAEKLLEDHVKKLFWALWGPSFGLEKITGKQMQDYMQLANSIHDTRLASLYVDPSASPPRPKITDSEVDVVLQLSERRLELAKLDNLIEPDSNAKKDIQWFLSLFDDQQKSLFVRSSVAMEKLKELGDPKEWIRWIRESFEESERVSRQLAERELGRPEPGDTEAGQPKWKIKVRLYSGSHSVRAKALNPWNQRCEVVKLYPAKNKNELLAEFILQKRIPVQGVWFLGFRIASAFVAALNIGTTGFFWWYLPEHGSRFYEKLTDLENGVDLTLDRNPPLRVNWGNLTLKETDLANVAAVYTYLISEGRDQSLEFRHYMRGLTFLSKNDIFFQVELNAFEEFFQALQNLLRRSGKWDGVSPFRPVALEAMHDLVRNPPALDSLLEMAEEYVKSRQPPKDFGLQQAIGMKVYCDACFGRFVKEKMAELMKGKPTSNASGISPSE